ncbi:Dimeric alpha-beta barrel [Neofusicoccum parvum]|uniref:Dimeric alpha-beta barrel n=1 Tax=Neofusicoccum parvum TaxID=310453 RepID=A0ACB5S2D2_9PEZI|nr:Dimeric alpha-beta barrel [Neofusicoccum parvum]
MTHKEFLDYHYQIHGAIADTPEDPDLKPHKYIQSHVFDSAFGAPPSPTPPNANHAWTGRSSVTELWFRDVAHMLRNFSSAWVRDTVGPDGARFADLASSINLVALEKRVPVDAGLAAVDVVVDEAGGRHACTALYWVALPGGGRDGAGVEEGLSGVLRRALEREARGEVYGLLVNVGLKLEEFDPASYFGGKDLPKFALVYKIYMRDGGEAVRAVRRAQKLFEEETGDGRVDAGSSFILFNKEALMMDVGEGFRFDKMRQPIFKDLV